MYVEEKNRSWCSSSNSNDQRAVTIECTSDTKHPYWMNDKVYSTLIKLCADICKRNLSGLEIRIRLLIIVQSPMKWFLQFTDGL